MRQLLLIILLFISLPPSLFAQEKEQFLVPIATDLVIGANGGRWFTMVRLFNYGDVPINLGQDVPFAFCDPGPTPPQLLPLMGNALCSLGSEYPPARIFDVAADKKIALESDLVTPAQQSVRVPIVPVRHFRKNLIFDAVRAQEGKRLALRLYHNEPGVVAVRLRIIGSRTETDQQIPVHAATPGKPGYIFIALTPDIFPPGAVRTILAESDVPIWGLVSSTDNETSEVVLHTPAAATPVPVDQQCP